MNIFRNTISMLFLMLSSGIHAQSITTDNPTVNIGQVLYQQPSKAIFSLRNSSASPISLTSVETGCGCMMADYPKGSIPAGGSFKISVTYDAKLLGHFQRNILVTDNTANAPLELTLQGNVVLNIENFSGEYPISIGGLLADNTAVEYDDVNKGDRLIREIHIMNPSGQYVEPVIMHTPDYLRTEIIPSRLAPKKSGIIRFTLDSRKLRSLGLNQTNIYLAANKGEKVSEDKEITVSAVLLPEQIAQNDINGPKLSLSTSTIDMTNFNGKKKKKEEVVLTNTGKSILEISSLQMFTQGLQVTLSKRKLMPGESTKMKITGIADQLKKTRTRPRILMITNAANYQKVIIDIKK